MLLTGGIAFNLCVVGMLMVPHQEDKTGNALNLKVFQIKSFWLLIINNFLFMFGYIIIAVNLPAYAKTKGIDPDKTSRLISFGGVANLIGRCLIFVFVFFPFVTSTMIYAACFLLCSVSTALVPFCNTYELLIIYNCVYNIAMGCLFSKLPLVIIEIVKEDLLASALGYILMAEAVGTLIGAPVAG